MWAVYPIISWTIYGTSRLVLSFTGLSVFDQIALSFLAAVAAVVGFVVTEFVAPARQNT